MGETYDVQVFAGLVNVRKGLASDGEGAAACPSLPYTHRAWVCPQVGGGCIHSPSNTQITQGTHVRTQL